MKKLHDPTRPDMLDGMDQEAAWTEAEAEVLAEIEAKKPQKIKPAPAPKNKQAA